MRPAEVIKHYHKHGYHVLAITDHDTMRSETPTWPWPESTNPYDLDMAAVKGNEISTVHHLGSYFNDYGDQTAGSEEEVLREIGKRNGLAVFFHPGRYCLPSSWYVDHFKRNNHLVKIEVYNQGDRYPQDRILWDKILVETLPEKPV